MISENELYMSFDGEYVYSIGRVTPENDTLELSILSPSMETIKTKEYSITYFQEQLDSGLVVPYE